MSRADRDPNDSRYRSQFDFGDAAGAPPRAWRRTLFRALRLLLILALLVGASAYLFDHRDRFSDAYSQWELPSLSGPSQASRQIFKWRDASGRTVYGDQPPPGVEATPIDASVLGRQNTVPGEGK